MKEFQEHKKTTRKVYSKTTLILMCIALVLITKGVFSVYSKEQESATETERVQNEKAELEKRYTNIVDQNEELKSDMGVESEIRNKFDVAKQGEGVIIIVDKTVPVVPEDNRSVLKKFWDSVTGVFGGSAHASSSVVQAQ